MQILGFCDSACIFALVCHENLEFLQFRMLFCACLSCEFGNSVILHVFSRMLVMRISNSCVFAFYFALVCHANLEFLQFRMLFRAWLSCGFWILCVSACNFISVRHADFGILRFCMYFRACLSCRFWDSAIPHVVSRLVVMRILEFCDSACDFVLSCHADFEFLCFYMLFCAWLSCGSGVSAIPHVFSLMLVMRNLNSCVFACYFAISCHANFGILRFCMYFRACLSCGFWILCVSACNFISVRHANLRIL